MNQMYYSEVPLYLQYSEKNHMMNELRFIENSSVFHKTMTHGNCVSVAFEKYVICMNK